MTARGIDPATAEVVVGRYGEEVETLMALVDTDPSLAQPLIPGRPYLRGEVPFAVRSELALTLEDVLRRRLHLFYEVHDGGLSVAREVASLMAAEAGIGWSAEELDRQLSDYAAQVEATRPGQTI